MRLINTRTLQFEEFVGYNIPRYAILSHTWEDEEVTFQDFLDQATAHSKKGWAKIEQACHLASTDGLEFAWVDTCCIDKSSSAELTEAINSMFAWYMDSAVCYAYLSDLAPADNVRAVKKVATCRWFTRGWTLQELIAPNKLGFYDAGWSYVGSKADWGGKIAEITGINEAILLASSAKELKALLRTTAVAQRMSWAASRQTTRIEDVAYCLLGIFDVNMPLLYGEGSKAFIRLQEELIKETNDMTLFAWEIYRGGLQAILHESVGAHGILAQSPKAFLGSQTLIASEKRNFMPEFTMTNKGLRLDGMYIEPSENPSRGAFLPLYCRRRESPDRELGIILRCMEPNIYYRCPPFILAARPPRSLLQTLRGTVYLAKHQLDRFEALHLDGFVGSLFFEDHKTFLDKCECLMNIPQGAWDAGINAFLAPPDPEHYIFYRMFRLRHMPSVEFVVVCTGHPMNVSICLASEHTRQDLFNAVSLGSKNMHKIKELCSSYTADADGLDIDMSGTEGFEHPDTGSDREHVLRIGATKWPRKVPAGTFWTIALRLEVVPRKQGKKKLGWLRR